MLIAVFILALNIINLHAKIIDINDEPVCDSRICKYTAQKIIDSMDKTKDACTNFFEYACGNYNETRKYSIFNTTIDQSYNMIYHYKEILESATSFNESSALTKAKTIYKACMDQDAIENTSLVDLSNLMDHFGGWPMAMTEEWKFERKSWQDVDIAFRKLMEFSLLFNLNVVVDNKNSSRQIIQLSPSTPFIITTATKIGADIYLKLPDIQNLKNVLKNASRLIANHRGSPLLIDEHLESDAVNVVKFLYELSEIMNIEEDTSSDLYTEISIADFQRAYDSMHPNTTQAKIDWLHIIKSHFAEVSNVSIDNTEVLKVVQKNYFFKLPALLDQTSSRTIVNTLNWKIVSAFGQSTSHEMRAVLSRIFLSSEMSSNSDHKWVECILENEMDHALAFAYIQKLPTKTKNVAKNIIYGIIDQIKTKINNNTWLDNESKEVVMKKLSAMRIFFGHSDLYKSIEDIDNYYEDLKVNQSYFNNNLAMNKFKLNKKLESFKEPVDKYKWITVPLMLKKYYSISGNYLSIPTGNLRSSGFSDELPDAFNYANIGSTIGHAISHGFDREGSEYDDKGNVRNWWTNTTKDEYYKRTQCFVEKFRNFSIEINGKNYTIDAITTLPENVAEFMGVSIAYEVFQIQKSKQTESKMRLPGLEDFNSNKLFFLTYANGLCYAANINPSMLQSMNKRHSPEAFKIMGVLSNMKSFAEAYNCEQGNKMNPTIKCDMW